MSDRKKLNSEYCLNLTHGNTKFSFQECNGEVQVFKYQNEKFAINDIVGIEPIGDSTIRIFLKDKNVDIQCDEAMCLRDLEEFLLKECDSDVLRKSVERETRN